MNVLFIGRSKRNTPLSPVVLAQAQSLKAEGLNLSFFSIEQGGFKGYFKASVELRNLIKHQHFDIFHAHYLYSGIVAVAASVRPLVVSLMGSDIHGSKLDHKIARFFNRFFWDACIVKSEEMKRQMSNSPAVFVIPNGVNLHLFKPLNKAMCMQQVGFDPAKKHILFLANPNRAEKNFALASQAFNLLHNEQIQMHVLYNLPQDTIPFYLSAADVLLLTSLYEGSPNVVKEAMACNLPIVSTRVGDVEQIIGKTEGCFVCGFNGQELAEHIQMALILPQRTRGREQISHLDSSSVAKQIYSLYTTLQH